MITTLQRGAVILQAINKNLKEREVIKMVGVTKEICSQLRRKGKWSKECCSLCAVRNKYDCRIKQEEKNGKV